MTFGFIALTLSVETNASCTRKQIEGGEEEGEEGEEGEEEEGEEEEKERRKKIIEGRGMDSMRRG